MRSGLRFSGVTTRLLIKPVLCPSLHDFIPIFKKSNVVDAPGSFPVLAVSPLRIFLRPAPFQLQHPDGNSSAGKTPTHQARKN